MPPAGRGNDKDVYILDDDDSIGDTGVKQDMNNTTVSTSGSGSDVGDDLEKSSPVAAVSIGSGVIPTLCHGRSSDGGYAAATSSGNGGSSPPLAATTTAWSSFSSKLQTAQARLEGSKAYTSSHAFLSRVGQRYTAATKKARARVEGTRAFASTHACLLRVGARRIAIFAAVLTLIIILVTVVSILASSSRSTSSSAASSSGRYNQQPATAPKPSLYLPTTPSLMAPAPRPSPVVYPTPSFNDDDTDDDPAHGFIEDDTDDPSHGFIEDDTDDPAYGLVQDVEEYDDNACRDEINSLPELSIGGSLDFDCPLDSAYPYSCSIDYDLLSDGTFGTDCLDNGGLVYEADALIFCSRGADSIQRHFVNENICVGRSCSETLIRELASSSLNNFMDSSYGWSCTTGSLTVVPIHLSG